MERIFRALKNTRHFILTVLLAYLLLPVPNLWAGESYRGYSPFGVTQEGSDWEGGDDDVKSQGRSGGGSGIPIGIGININVTDIIKALGNNSSNLPKSLAKDGPQFPDTFNMSLLTIRGFVKGNWPMVIDYRLEQESSVRVEVTAEGVEPFVYRLEGTGLQRRQVIFTLPERFGSAPQPGVISIRAVKDSQGEERLAPFRVYGLGAGPKAVGSVAIDQVTFQPASIYVNRKQKASYSFYSRSDFNKVVVEFRRIDDENGIIDAKEVVKREPIGEVRRLHWVGSNGDRLRTWDGEDEKKQVSPGLHMLLVRAWRSSAAEGDWVASWSENWVEVSE